MKDADISWDDAILRLTIAQMDFGMQMPEEWLKHNGPGSEYMEAVKKALYAMEQMKERESQDEPKYVLTKAMKEDLAKDVKMFEKLLAEERE